jgi:hypothetical protein
MKMVSRLEALQHGRGASSACGGGSGHRGEPGGEGVVEEKTPCPGQQTGCYRERSRQLERPRSASGGALLKILMIWVNLGMPPAQSVA